MKIFVPTILILFSIALTSNAESSEESLYEVALQRMQNEGWTSNAESSEESLYEVAFQKMQNEGWTPVHVLGTVIKNNIEYIIVRTSFMSNWAIELPITSRFPKGKYWARTSFMNGVTRMIDNSGIERSFMLSDSFEL
jgi:hypothetical protein